MHCFDFVGFKMPPKTRSGRTKTGALPHGSTSTGESFTLETGAPPQEQNEKIIGLLERLSDRLDQVEKTSIGIKAEPTSRGIKCGEKEKRALKEDYIIIMV